MISKIIQKAKELQREYKKRLSATFKPWLEREESGSTVLALQEAHKQFLINLKEYLKSELSDTEFDLSLVSRVDSSTLHNIFTTRISQLKEDIKALEEMIERYE